MYLQCCSRSNTTQEYIIKTHRGRTDKQYLETMHLGFCSHCNAPLVRYRRYNQSNIIVDEYTIRGKQALRFLSKLTHKEERHKPDQRQREYYKYGHPCKTMQSIRKLNGVVVEQFKAPVKVSSLYG